MCQRWIRVPAPPLLWLRGELDKISKKIEPVMEYPLVIFNIWLWNAMEIGLLIADYWPKLAGEFP